MRLLLALTLAPLAAAGDVVIEATGTVVQANASGSSPFNGAVVGDPVVVHFEVFVPGSVVSPGQFENYAIDGAASFVRIGGVTDALTGGNVGIQNDFPVADGIRVFGAPAAGGGSVSFEVGESSGTLFSSTDITQQLGSWPSSTWSSYSFMLTGGGSFIEFSLPDVAIFVPPVGMSYCSPATVNSTGVAATLTGLGTPSVAANDLRLVARGLPQQSFGYLIVSRTQGTVSMPAGSAGTLCLGGLIGRFVGQIQNSGATGEFTTTVDLLQTPQPMGAVAGQAGDTWNFQAWFRDITPSGSSNFTDGLTVVLS